MNNKGFSSVIVLFFIALLIFAVAQVVGGGVKLEGIATLFKPPWSTSSTIQVKQPPISSQGNTPVSTPTEPEKPKVIPPEGYKESDLSPYYKKVRISSVRPPSGFQELDSSFVIEAESNNAESISVTGWRVRGNRKGSEVVIPQAIADINPPYGFQKGDIKLGSGQSVTMYSWRKDSGVPNIRLNKCTGFLNDLYAFSPSLPNECPRVESARMAVFTGQCQNFLRSLSSCRIPTANEINQFTGPLDGECRTIIDQQNYGSCYRVHRNETDFFSREWRVWLNEFMFFDTLHDRLILLDKEGRVVNEYIY
ncbi:MAG: hypothetical protein WCW78_01010 [Candidatus Paceibacterota bacterium]|jgi:hypothetical protein